VLVREFGPPDWLRVSVGTPADMAAFRTALAEVLAGQPALAVPGGVA
jgi:histidinol-phosphate aminotransferase